MAIRIGTSGPDALEGTSEGDLIQGLDGNDLIDASSSTASPPNDGPDTVDGGAGNDTLTISSIEPLPGGTLVVVAGTNVDVSSTSTAMDVNAESIEFIRFFGSFGDDTVISEDSANVLQGGSGIDTWTGLYDGVGSTIRFVINTPSLLIVPNLNQIHGFERINLTTGGGNDIVTSGHQNDNLVGGPGNDKLNPGSVRDAPAGTIDVVDGQLGNDTLVIDARADQDGVSLAIAGAPNFIVTSVSGDFAVNGFSMDRVEFTGGQGNDTINTGTGAVLVDGRKGIDHWLGDLSGATSRVNFDHANPATHRLDQLGIRLITDVERYSLTGSRFNDTITTHNQADSVDGGNGNDIVDLKTRPRAPGSPTDTFVGGLGEDTLVVDASGESRPVQLFSAAAPRFSIRSDSGNFFVDAFGVEKVFFTGGFGADVIDTGDAGGQIRGGSRIDHWISNFGGFTRDIVFRLGDSELRAVEMDAIFDIERITMTTGSGNDRAADSGSFGPHSASSSWSSVRSVTASHVRPVCVARLTTDATPPALTPTLRAVSRWLRCRVHFSRRISRICRMGSRSVAIGCSGGRKFAEAAMVERRPLSLAGDHDAWNR